MNALPAYPDRAVRYVVPFGDGITASQARWLAQKLSKRWAQPVNVECHAGASGRTGTDLVAKSAPDGYTLLAANPGPLTVGTSLRKKLAYDPIADFAPIILMATVTSVICVHPAVPATNIAELVALARAREGALRYGSPGVGTVGHLAMEWFQHLAGIRLAHLPREGLPEAIPKLASGEFDVLVIPLPDARALALDGRIRALALTKTTRCALWPELPTVHESGVSGFDSFNWNGVAAPAGTPRAIVERVNTDVNDVLQSAEGRDYFTGKGYDIAGGTPEAFAAFIQSEKQKWARIVQLAGIAAT